MKFASNFVADGAMLVFAILIIASTNISSQPNKKKQPEKKSIASQVKSWFVPQPQVAPIQSERVDSLEKAMKVEAKEISKELSESDKQKAVIESQAKTIAILTKANSWWESYVAKLKAENNGLVLLKRPRPRGDTSHLITFTTEDMEYFVQHIADSVKATMRTDTVHYNFWGKQIKRKNKK